MTPIRDVFISSIQRDYADIRAGAKRAIEALGKRAVMAEQSSDTASPQQSLLGDVARSDALVLILGPRYGDRGASGVSPTEEEYQEALRRGIPTIVLVQDIEHEDEQADFIGRIGGTWEGGTRYSKFSGTEDIQAMVVEGLRRLDDAPATAELVAAAAAKIDAMAAASRSAGYGIELALLAAPATDSVLLRAPQVQDPAVTKSLIRRARELGIFDESEGVHPDVSRYGVLLQAHVSGVPRIEFNSDGSLRIVLRTCDLTGTHIGSVIDPSVLEPSMISALAFASEAWVQFDTHGEIHQVAVAVVMHGADSANYGPPPAGSTITMPGFGRMPSPLVAPTSPLIIPAINVSSRDTVEALMAEVRLPFAEVGALT